MAQWIEGKITFQPGDGGEAPDPETDDLVPVLAALRRAGFVTTCSQPGERAARADDDFAQRAFVDGYLSDEAWALLSATTRTSELVVISVPPGRRGGLTQIPVTYADGEERTWVGTLALDEGAEYWWNDHVHPDAVRALGEAWQVEIVDPVWGRNDRLWRFLEIFATA
jgi:hypothetical protein